MITRALFESLFDNSSYVVNILKTHPITEIYRNPKAKVYLPEDECFKNHLSQKLGFKNLNEYTHSQKFLSTKKNPVEVVMINPDNHKLIKSALRQIEIEKESFIIIESSIHNANFQNLIETDVHNLMQQVIDLVPEPIFLKDNQRRFVMVNQCFLSYHNATYDQVIGQTDEAIKKYPNEYQKFIEDDTKVINSGQSLHVKRECFTDFKGRKVTLKTTKVPFYWHEDEKPGIIGIAIDITEKLASRQKLQSNRKMQRQIVDLVPHMIFLKDHEGKFAFVNKEFIKRSGISESDILGKTVFEIYPEEQAKRYHEEDMRVINTLQELVIEKEFGPIYEGSISIFTTTKKPYFTYDSNKVGVLSICVDLTEKFRNKEMLDQQKVILNEIINLLPQEIYLKDEEGRMILVNKACADHLQLPAEYLIGKTDFDFFDKESAQEFFNLEQEILKDGKKRHIAEEHSIDKNNVRRIKNVLKMPFYLSDKRRNGILGMNIDITEAKKAEKQLKDSEFRYKTLMEQASDGIYLSDESGNIIAANQKAAELFGYEEEEFKKINIKGIVLPDVEIVRGLPIPYKADKQSLILEKKFQKKDGNTFTAELSVKLLDDGMHQAILRDVTERKKMEKILVDNERKFRLLIENSSDIIIIVSKNFIIQFLSPSVSRLLGYHESELIGTSVLEILLDKDVEVASQLFSKILSNNQPLVGEELKIKNANGDYLLFETVAVNMLEDDNINGIIINCHDITNRKKTENELINTNFELDSFVYKA